LPVPKKRFIRQVLLGLDNLSFSDLPDPGKQLESRPSQWEKRNNGNGAFERAELNDLRYNRAGRRIVRTRDSASTIWQSAIEPVPRHELLIRLS
jgi:hypothetical protein